MSSSQRYAHLTCLEMEDDVSAVHWVTKILPACEVLATLRLPNLSLCPAAVWLSVLSGQILATVRILDVSGCTRIADWGLACFTLLEELNVSDNPLVTTVAPVAHTLRILHARGPSCGIGDAGLANATQLEELNVSGNGKVTDVNHFPKLRILDASRSGITDAGLVNATLLEELNVSGNGNVTHVHLFPKLRILDASGSNCGIGDAGLVNATLLEELNVSDNGNVTHVRPCAKTLVKLVARGTGCGINDDGLTGATQLQELDSAFNTNITRVVRGARNPPANNGRRRPLH